MALCPQCCYINQFRVLPCLARSSLIILFIAHSQVRMNSITRLAWWVFACSIYTWPVTQRLSWSSPCCCGSGQRDGNREWQMASRQPWQGFSIDCWAHSAIPSKRRVAARSVNSNMLRAISLPPTSITTLTGWAGSQKKRKKKHKINFNPVLNVLG